MTFDILNFASVNRRVLIWTSVFALAWAIWAKGIFSLFFITFILSFTFNPIINWLARRTGWPRKLWVAIVYLVFIAVITLLLSHVVPKLGSESRTFFRGLPAALAKIDTLLLDTARQHPALEKGVQGMRKWLTLEQFTGMDTERIFAFTVASLNEITNSVSYFLIGTLFSFLFQLDLPRMNAKMRNLRETRLRAVFDEVEDKIGQFATVVGVAFRAQIVIALANTALTTIGMLVLAIKPVALLASLVFAAGLIPVLGTFISSVPIILLAFNGGGFTRAFFALGMILFVHLFENYVVNPRIFSHIFKIRPVFVLIILYVGYSFFGLWGVVLGVPVSAFVFKHLICPPDWLGTAPTLHHHKDTGTDATQTA
jgi:predicted PurR-regulated permease PerM